MKLRLLLTLIGCLAVAPVATQAETLTNDKVIALSKAGLSDETILTAIRQSDADFELEADELIALREAGVSANVIEAMQQKNAAGPAAAIPSPTRTRPAEARSAQRMTADLDRLGPPQITPKIGETYYTRFTFKYEGDEFPTTNYWRGALVPINTKVQLLEIDDDSFDLLIEETGMTVEVENVEKYSKRSVLQYAQLMLADRPTSLSQFPEEIQQAIQMGDPRPGMTKEQVIYARGYPPAHQTPSLKSPEWMYWYSRFNKRAFHFNANGILSNIEN
ncbi:MAG: hypothetical protein Q7P63_03810 [Verrucomicrobiota bacterium JB022]|nr:hypothetical protein [Verrucomicrobiota bacterium JB022]